MCKIRSPGEFIFPIYSSSHLDIVLAGAIFWHFLCSSISLYHFRFCSKLTILFSNKHTRSQKHFNSWKRFAGSITYIQFKTKTKLFSVAVWVLTDFACQVFSLWTQRLTSPGTVAIWTATNLPCVVTIISQWTALRSTSFLCVVFPWEEKLLIRNYFYFIGR